MRETPAVETGIGQRDNSLLWAITTAGSNRAGGCVAELSEHCEKICLNPAGYRLRPELSDD
jgi:phage terminase large subunit-like protein